jgi:predicted dehydrogenase
MRRRINRRHFLQSSGAAATAAGFWLTGGLSESRAAQNTPNERLNVAFVGCGGQGGGNVNNTAGVPGVNVVALCDVDDARAKGAFDRYPNVTKYKDFRVMLEKQKDIDAVVVSTPDNTHFHAALLAMRAGKHVYCEKPLTHDVWEARQLAETARQRRVATQMGNQGTSANGTREAAEILRSGAIGDVREVHAWTDRPGTYWRQGHTQRPKERPPVPPTLDWDKWLGPAPERPYSPAYVPFAWRGWWDFGTGALGDMGCHILNLTWMALRPGAPSSVVAEVDQPINNESPPNGALVTYEFPARDSRPAFTLKWYEVRRPPMELFEGQRLTGGGSLFIGTKGKLYSNDDYGARYILLPRDQFESYRRPDPSLPRSPGHHAEWVRACKGGPAAMSNFPDYSGPLTEMVLLGNVAMKAGRRIVWDSAKLQCVDNADATRYLRREYRKGWEI